MIQDPARDILTPSQLNTLARDLLESAFPLVFLLATAAVTVYTGLLYLKREQAEPIL